MKRINRTERTKYNIIAGAINRACVLIMGFLVRTFLIHILGTQYVGLSGVVTSILNVLNLAELGFHSAIVYNLYKPVAEENEEQICALLSFYRKAYLVIGSIVLGAGLALFPLLHIFIHSDIPNNVNINIVYFAYLFNTCSGYFFFGYINVLLSAHQRNDIDSYLATITFIIEYGAQIFVLVLFKSYYLYIFVIPLTTIIMNIARYIIVRRMFPQYICKGTIDDSTRQSVYENIKGLVIQKICASTRNTFDSIFISGYIGLVAAGLYSNYYYIISSVHGILVVLHSAMSAGIGNSIAIETQDKNHKDMMIFIFIYSWLSGICTICLLCLYQPFMKLWAGKNNLLPFFDVVLFCLYFYAITLGDIRSNYSAGAGLWWHERYRSIAEMISNILLNAILGKIFGIPGIIAATLITIVFINFFYGSSIIYKHYFTKYKVGTFFRRSGLYFGIMVLAAVPTYLLSSALRVEGVFGLIGKAIVSMLIPNIFFFCVYSKTSVFKDSYEMFKRMIRSNPRG